jgi:hypothetical protein
MMIGGKRGNLETRELKNRRFHSCHISSTHIVDGRSLGWSLTNRIPGDGLQYGVGFYIQNPMMIHTRPSKCIRVEIESDSFRSETEAFFNGSNIKIQLKGMHRRGS